MAISVFVTLLGGGVHLMLANPPWRQLQERAGKIPGDKKHVEGILSQSHCVAQFHKVQNRLPEPLSASLGNVQNGAGWKCVVSVKDEPLISLASIRMSR